MRQAIVTRFLGPTNYRCARVKAVAEAGSVTLPWDDELGIAENHEAAAMALVARYGWRDRWVSGALPGGGYVFVNYWGQP